MQLSSRQRGSCDGTPCVSLSSLVDISKSGKRCVRRSYDITAPGRLCQKGLSCRFCLPWLAVVADGHAWFGQLHWDDMEQVSAEHEIPFARAQTISSMAGSMARQGFCRETSVPGCLGIEQAVASVGDIGRDDPASTLERRPHARIDMVVAGCFQPECGLLVWHMNDGARKQRFTISCQATDMVWMEVGYQHDVDVGGWMARRHQLRRHPAQCRVLQIACASIDENAMLAIIDQKRVDVAGHDVAEAGFHQERIERCLTAAQDVMGRKWEVSIA